MCALYGQCLLRQNIGYQLGEDQMHPSRSSKMNGNTCGPNWLATCPKMDAFSSETATFRETGFFFLDGNHVLHNLCLCSFTLNLGFACQR